MALGTAGAIARVVMVISVTILSRILLKEKTTPIKWLSIFLSIVALFLVVQPDFIFKTNKESEVDNGESYIGAYASYVVHKFARFSDLTQSNVFYLNGMNESVNSTTNIPDQDSSASVEMEILGYFFLLIAGCSSSATNVFQKFRLNNENPLAINFWTSFVMTVIPLVLSLIVEWDSITFPTDPINILLVLGQSFALATSYIFGIRAISMAPAIWIIMAYSIQIFFLIIAQHTILSGVQPGKDNWIEVFGAVVVVIAAVLSPLWEFIKLQCSKRTVKVTPYTT